MFSCVQTMTMYDWKSRAILILGVVLLSLAGAHLALAQEPVTGLFGEITAVSPAAPGSVVITVSTAGGPRDMRVTGDTVLEIPGKDPPSVSDLALGQYIAATARMVSGQLVAVKVLVKPQQPSKHTHVVGVVTGKEGNQVMLVNKDGESISVILPVGFPDVEQGTAVTAVVRRDPDTQDLSVRDLRTASQEINDLERLVKAAAEDPRPWVLDNVKAALQAATSRHLSLLFEVASKVAPAAQNTLTQVLQIQQARYQQTLQDLDLAPPAIEVTGVVWFMSAADRSVTIRLFPLDRSESINVMVTGDTKIIWEGQIVTFDELSSRPASETTGFTVAVQYEVGSFEARYIRTIKKELSAGLLERLLGEVGKDEAEGRAVQKNTATTPQTVVIALAAGGILTLNVTPDTKVYVADQEAQLLQVPLNARVKARYEPGTLNAIEITVIIDRPDEAFLAGVVTQLVRKAHSITVTTRLGDQVVLGLPDDAKIFRNGSRVSIQEVQLGDLVHSSSRYNTRTREIVALVLQSPVAVEFSGVVVGLQSRPTNTGVEANYVTVASDNGLGLLTVRVSAATDVVRNGQAATFASIRVGDRVVDGAYRLTVAFEQATNEATRLRLESAQVLKTQGGITAINAGARTFTVQPPIGGPVTFLFTSATEAWKDGAADIGLGQLQVGDTVVEVTYSPDTGEVARLVVLSSDTLTTRGVIKDISLSQRRMTVRIGEQEVVLTITLDTVLVRDGQTVELAQMSPTDIVVAAYYKVDGTATRIEVRSPNVVTAVRVAIRATAGR